MHRYLLSSVLCDWHTQQRYEPVFRQQLQQQTPLTPLDAASVYPFDTLRLELAPRTVVRIAQQHAAHALTTVRQLGGIPYTHEASVSLRLPGRSVRLGYLCGNIGDHPLVQDMLQVWLRQTRRQQTVVLVALNTYNHTEDELGLLAAVDELYGM